MPLSTMSVAIINTTDREDVITLVGFSSPDAAPAVWIGIRLILLVVRWEWGFSRLI
jgi:hypothetical protein